MVMSWVMVAAAVVAFAGLPRRHRQRHTHRNVQPARLDDALV